MDLFRRFRDRKRGKAPSPENPPPVPPVEEFQQFLDAQGEPDSLPQLELGQYRTILGRRPRPTETQVRRFAEYTAEAKSWYKHLPLLPPGVPFHFFLDPWAGLDRILQRDGAIAFINRTEETPRYHHSWMTTGDYRSRFSQLSFACATGTKLYWPVSCRLDEGRDISGFMANNPCRATIHLSEELEVQLPYEVLEAGTVLMTGVVHRLAARPWVFLKQIEPTDDPLAWPEETGGPPTARKIMDLCQRLAAREDMEPVEEAENGNAAAEEDLGALLEPERRRLEEQMVEAMLRVIALVY